MRRPLILLVSVAAASFAFATKVPGIQDQAALLSVRDDSETDQDNSYDQDGRQEAVNVGPGMKAIANNQIRPRARPRGRQRGAVLPHKFIVRLKNGVDLSSRK